MGACLSIPPEPPVKQHVASVQPSAPPIQTYNQTYAPPYYNQMYAQQYTYAVKPQQVYYQQQPQQYPYPQYQYQFQTQPPQVQPYPPRNDGVSTGVAVAGGFLLGSILENMMDPE